MTTERGAVPVEAATPYENEQGDYWVAVGDVGSVEDARTVLPSADGIVYDFVGIEDATLMEGDWGDPAAPSRLVAAYHFVQREGFSDDR